MNEPASWGIDSMNGNNARSKMPRRFLFAALLASLLLTAKTIPDPPLSGGTALVLAATFIEYPIPTTPSGPFFITPGPDGALWFTEFPGNKIGRIATTGSITEYPIPTPSSGANGIVAGPDGALWFTE